MNAPPDSTDLREIGSALRHGWRWVAGGALTGLLLGVLATVMVPPMYRAQASILLRSEATGASALGGSSSKEEGGGLGGLVSILGGGSEFDTEMEILTSRSVLSSVIDTLGLQARVREPTGVAARSLFSAAVIPHDLERAVYRFERTGSEYRVQGPATDERVVPGAPVQLGTAQVTLRPGPLPEAFEVELMDMDQAVKRLRKSLRASKAGGDVAELVFTAADPATAAAVPNAVMAHYLARRKTTDRGVNQHRYEFLQQHTDSIAHALAQAERQLRAYQERSGVLDPATTGSRELDRAARLRAELEALRVEGEGLRQVLSRGSVSARDVAAYPTLLRNGAINGIFARLSEAESQRNTLLERRTEQDPDVITLTATIRYLERELFTVSRAYLDGLERQAAQIRDELRGYQETIATLPAHAEETYRLDREVRRLSETLVALQTQLVQTRLAAIAEGGEVRPIDTASPPRRPAFPIPVLNLAGGLFGGMFFGAVGAVATATVRRRIRAPWEAELAAGAPAIRLDPEAPLLLGDISGVASVLVVSATASAAGREVAQRLSATLALRGTPVALVDLAGDHPASAGDLPGRHVLLPNGDGTNASEPSVPAGFDAGTADYPVYRVHPEHATTGAIRQGIEELESRSSLPIVALRGLYDPVTVALLSPRRAVVLVVPAASADRNGLEQAARDLRRSGAALHAVVLTDGGVRPAAERSRKSILKRMSQTRGG